MAKVWQGAYWKSKKGSPWFMGLLAVVLLWAYGHTHAVAGPDGHPGAHPSTSASATARPGHAGHPPAKH